MWPVEVRLRFWLVFAEYVREVARQTRLLREFTTVVPVERSFSVLDFQSDFRHLNWSLIPNREVQNDASSFQWSTESESDQDWNEAESEFSSECEARRDFYPSSSESETWHSINWDSDDTYITDSWYEPKEKCQKESTEAEEGDWPPTAIFWY
ncbi:unnamed protein product [Allacma fusca]|uniref:Uncharacterized protein n=1 Tax=Allacma fusca TaxID=39272 RepID=A0A8J2JTH4_9HEXA|nr:unnamed protein product [Allacma fusca]